LKSDKSICMRFGGLLGALACGVLASGPVEWYGPSEGIHPRTAGMVPNFNQAFEFPGKGYLAIAEWGDWGVGFDTSGSVLWRQDLTGPLHTHDPLYLMDTAFALGSGFAGIKYSGETDFTTLLRYNAYGILQDQIHLGRPIASLEGGYLAVRDSASDTGFTIRRPVVVHLDSNGTEISRAGLETRQGSSGVRAILPMGSSWMAVSWIKGADQDSSLLQDVTSQGVPGSFILVPLGGRAILPNTRFPNPISAIPYNNGEERLLGLVLANPAPMDPNQVLSSDTLVLYRVRQDGKVLDRSGYPLLRSSHGGSGHQGSTWTSVSQDHEIESMELRPDGKLRVRIHDWSNEIRADPGPYLASRYLELLWSPGQSGIVPAGSQAPPDFRTRCGILPTVPDGHGNFVAWSDCQSNVPFLFIQYSDGNSKEIQVPEVAGVPAYFRPTRDGGAILVGSFFYGDVIFPMIKLEPDFATVGVRPGIRARRSGPVGGGGFDALGRFHPPELTRRTIRFP